MAQNFGPENVQPYAAGNAGQEGAAASFANGYAPMQVPGQAYAPQQSLLMAPVTQPQVTLVAAPRPEPPATTYLHPWELVHMPKWWKGYGYSATLRDTYRNPWWTPLATVSLGVVLYQLVSFAVFIIIGFIIAGQLGTQLLLSSFDPSLALDMSIFADLTNPISIIFLFGSVAAMLPGFWWAVKIIKRQSFGSISSVFGHLRWAALGKSTILAFVLFFILNGASLALDLANGGSVDFNIPSILTIVITLTVVPVQCATEEYIFRGILLQGFGRWIPRAAHILVPIIPAIIFTSLHNYDWLGLSTVFSLGLITGYLAMYLGGLEAGIAIHIANNVTIVLFQSIGLYDSSSDSSSMSWISVVLDIGIQLLFAAIIVWAAMKRGWFDKAGRDFIGDATKNLRQSVKNRRAQRKAAAAYGSADYASAPIPGAPQNYPYGQTYGQPYAQPPQYAQSPLYAQQQYGQYPQPVSAQPTTVPSPSVQSPSVVPSAVSVPYSGAAPAQNLPPYSQSPYSN